MDGSITGQIFDIDLVKKQRLFKGRQRVRLPENFKECLEKYNDKESGYKIKDFIKDTGIKTATLFRVIKEFKNKTVHPDRFLPSKKKKKL